MSTLEHDTVYLVLQDFGSFGQAYRETDPSQADRQTVLANLLCGEYERPLRIVAFNPTEGWARDVTAEIAGEALTHSDQEDFSLAACEFVQRFGQPGAKSEQSWLAARVVIESAL
jgi:hypothetical protein